MTQLINIRIISWTVLVAVMLLLHFPNHAAASVATDECIAKSDKTWTDTEGVVWNSLCKGIIADLSNRSEGDRVLRFEFFASILSDQTLVQLLPTRAVSLSNVKVVGDWRNLVNATVDTLSLKNTEIDHLVLHSPKMRELRIEHSNVNVIRIDGGKIDNLRLLTHIGL